MSASPNLWQASQVLETAVDFARNQAGTLDLLFVYFLYDKFEPRDLLLKFLFLLLFLFLFLFFGKKRQFEHDLDESETATRKIFVSPRIVCVSTLRSMS